ncbi:hypothetical protein Ciccas_009829 [Cichlidogyrus casuarinus]|uniref:Uncharacterized protein n=1 Tax=Cichlidogyrus casuarinus TaxID=1844966 RepID=A0ABD2PXE2_9PLAT
MDDEQREKQNKASVLTDMSLLNLAKALKDGDFRIYLYLGLPLTRLIYFYELTREMNQKENAFKQRCLMEWKELRTPSKDSSKVKDLEYALRASEHGELADIFVERHRLKLELTKDLFVTTN